MSVMNFLAQAKSIDNWRIVVEWPAGVWVAIFG